MKRVGITELRTRTPKPGGDSLLTWEKGPAWLRPTPTCSVPLTYRPPWWRRPTLRAVDDAKGTPVTEIEPLHQRPPREGWAQEFCVLLGIFVSNLVPGLSPPPSSPNPPHLQPGVRASSCGSWVTLSPAS